MPSHNGFEMFLSESRILKSRLKLADSNLLWLSIKLIANYMSLLFSPMNWLEVLL